MATKAAKAAKAITPGTRIKTRHFTGPVEWVESRDGVTFLGVTFAGGVASHLTFKSDTRITFA